MKTLSFAGVNPGHIEQFQQQGYFVLPNVYSPDEVDDIEAFFEEFKRKGGNVYDRGASYEEVDLSKEQLRAMNLHHSNRQVASWLVHPHVATVLETLLGRPALAAQSMYYFKPPGGRGQAMHQDNFYLIAQPFTCVGAWTAIDDADEENGCLYFVPGSHRSEILCPSDDAPRWMNYGDSHIGHFPKGQKAVPILVPRGHTVFFSGNLIHGSGPNRSQTRFRRNFIGHYIDGASEQVSRFYHPVLDMQGEPVDAVKMYEGGGPCGGEWHGAAH